MLLFIYSGYLKVISQLQEAFSRGQMDSLCVGPVSIFLSKVAHPAELKEIGETLARLLNFVIMDERDKEAAVARECLLRAMISCQWIFRDFDNLGWLEEQEDVEHPESDDKLDSEDSVVELTPTVSYVFTSILNFVSGLLRPLWRLPVLPATGHQHVIL